MLKETSIPVRRRRNSLSNSKTALHENCHRWLLFSPDPNWQLMVAELAINNIQANLSDIRHTYTQYAKASLHLIEHDKVPAATAIKLHVQKCKPLSFAKKYFENHLEAWQIIATEIKAKEAAKIELYQTRHSPKLFNAHLQARLPYLQAVEEERRTASRSICKGMLLRGEVG